ncbi:unnamed protein product [Adineta steineri]|uniref:Sodium/calcium exchanger membrane region domain-containing protein n=1 Tax=Adineta steineri TaxID=433720 RepID=A0A818I5M2_9BILA|nr:unnamed protein product [Adineta steineri]CAF3516770.1 unnamed protein product [Adineta steineri]
MQAPSFSLLSKQEQRQRPIGSQIVNRHNVKFLIRILVGLTLAHIVGQRFQPSNAAPSSTKSNWKHRPQKIQSTTLSDGQVNDDKTTTIITTTSSLTTPGWQPGQQKNCTDPAIDEFPEDLFTQSQRRSGAIIFHFIACLYIFIAIAVVVDDYFISALDKLCATLGLDEDVAGATFMAGGSSSPELFTAIIGIFVAKGDVGVGTIVGSAVFNVVCVIGVCGLFVNAAIRLTWWPLCRDSVYYSVSILILIMCLSDGRITLFESTFLLLMYAGYIVIMCNNQRLQRIIVGRLQVFQSFGGPIEPIMNYANTQKTYGLKNTYEQFDEDDDGGHAYNNSSMRQNQLPLDEHIAKSRIPIDFETAALKIMMSRYFRSRTRFKMAVRFVISHLRSPGCGTTHPQKPANERRFSFYQGRTPSLLAADANFDDWKRIPNYNYDPINFAKWIITAPIKIVFYFTIPDCRNPRWFKWYPFTFIMAIVWLCLLTYLMVWMVTIIGYTFGIPDSVMGITFLAAGSSVPDAMSSVLVVRQGLVDMGVSNTFGSNVFDLLVGLALPWFFKALISGEAVHINSNGLMYDSVLLLGIVALTVISFHRRKWYLDKNLGIFFLGVYGIFVVVSLLIELNVFGFVNPPMC